MAHGNFTDLVFFALLAIAIQFFAFPNTLFDGQGPWTADNNNADTSGIITYAGSLLLMIGLMFSGVKWNPINGKLAGIGGFIAAIVTAISTFQGDSDTFVPHVFYLYAIVVFAGALNVFAFPSNPVPPKTPETKSNHGNFSDVIFLILVCCALLCIFDPDHLMKDQVYLPIKAQFTPSSSDNGALRVMIKFTGGLMLMIAMIFSGEKWNPISGKLAGIGGFIAAIVTAVSTFRSGGGFKYFYVYSVVLFAGALHIFAFPANPIPTKPEADAAVE